MTAPLFCKLTLDEYGKLSLKERIEYMRRLIEHVGHRIKDTGQAIQARSKNPARK